MSDIVDTSCALCYEVMDQPVRCGCPCGNTTCRDCYMHALSTCHNRCPFTRQPIDWSTVRIDQALLQVIAQSDSRCSYAGCDFAGTVAACVAHERECSHKVTVRPGYYHLHNCSDTDVNVFDACFVANDLYFQYLSEENPTSAADSETSTQFTVGSVLGVPWKGHGCLRRNGSSGFYIWSEPDGTEVSYTTIHVLPSGDIVGRVRGDPAKGAHWTYRSVFVSAEPPQPVPSDDEGEEVDVSTENSTEVGSAPREPR